MKTALVPSFPGFSLLDGKESYLLEGPGPLGHLGDLEKRIHLNLSVLQIKSDRVFVKLGFLASKYK